MVDRCYCRLNKCSIISVVNHHCCNLQLATCNSQSVFLARKLKRCKMFDFNCSVCVPKSFHLIVSVDQVYPNQKNIANIAQCSITVFNFDQKLVQFFSVHDIGRYCCIWGMLLSFVVLLMFRCFVFFLLFVLQNLDVNEKKTKKQQNNTEKVSDHIKI